MSDRNYGALRDPELIEKFIDRIIAQSEDSSFAKGKPFAFDIEAGYTGPDAEGISKMQFHPNYILVGISFTNSSDWARYVPIAHDDGDNATDIPRVARAFWRLVNTGKGIAHNVSYELKGMSRWFREVLWNDPEVGHEVRESKGMFPFLADTMILVWLSQEYEPAVAEITQKDLKQSVYVSFGMKMTKFAELFPKEDSEMGPKTKTAQEKLRFNTRYSTSARVIAYACEDSVGSLMLYEKHKDLFENERALITKVEHQLVPVLIEMEMGPVDENGVAQGNMFLNWKLIYQKEEELTRFKDRFEEEILEDFSERLGRIVTLNMRSHDQMRKVLYEPAPEGLGLPVNDRFRSKETGAASTGEDALKVLANTDPLIKKLLLFRQVGTLWSSYLHKYATQLNYSGTGFVFPNHNQAGTVTGRMSVDQVSYQQWPKPQHYELRDGTSFDINFRDFLVAPPEHRQIGFDYSQVELRFLAAVAHEDSMLRAFADGTDIHKLTASRMFHMPIEEVDKKSRGKGKTLNFGIVYQQAEDALSESLTASGTPTTPDEAKKLLEQYYDGFPKLRNWMDEQIAIGHNQGYVTTFFGRKFVVWEFQDPRQWIRNKGDRMCINAPIQGGAADYMKIALVRAYQALKKAGLLDKVRMTMSIHDALELMVHKSIDTQTVIDILNPAVSYPVKGLPVQIRADWHEGPTWGMLSEIKIDADAKITHYELEDVDGEYATYDEAIARLRAIEAEKPKAKTIADVPPPKMTLERLFKVEKVTPTRQKKIRELCETNGKSTTTLDKEVTRIGGWELLRALYAEEQEPAQEQASEALDQEEAVREQDTVQGRAQPLAGEELKAALKRDTDAARARREAGLKAAEEAGDAPWMAHHYEEEPVKKFFVVLSEMPEQQQWDDFQDWLKPGDHEVVVKTPEGEYNDGKKYAIEMADQGLISLLLGGADLYFETDSADIAAVAGADV